MSEKWTRLPPLDNAAAGFRSNCLTCGPQPVMLSLDAIISVGFGSAGVTKDGIGVWEQGDVDDDCITLADAEKMAAADPDHDWRVFFAGPLSETEYQRHEAKNWVLVKKGDGFA